MALTHGLTFMQKTTIGRERERERERQWDWQDRRRHLPKLKDGEQRGIIWPTSSPALSKWCRGTFSRVRKRIKYGGTRWRNLTNTAESINRSRHPRITLGNVQRAVKEDHARDSPKNYAESKMRILVPLWRFLISAKISSSHNYTKKTRRFQKDSTVLCLVNENTYPGAFH